MPRVESEDARKQGLTISQSSKLSSRQVYLEPVHLGWEPLIVTWGERFQAAFPQHRCLKERQQTWAVSEVEDRGRAWQTWVLEFEA